VDTRVRLNETIRSGDALEAGPSGPAAPTGSEASLKPPRTTRARRLAIRGAVVALVVALLGLGLRWFLMPSTRLSYVTAPVTRGKVAPYVTASGSVNPVVTVQVGTYVSGVIENLYCDFNTRVKAGQLCAKIDPRPYQVVVDQDKAALAAAKAQLVKDQASLAYAKVNFERQVKLVAQDSASQDAADVARSTYEQMRAQVGLDQATIVQRQADLEAAQVNLGYTNITSPVDGTVVSRDITQGQTVAASFQTPTLFLIATDLTHMQVDTSVSESDVGSVRLDNEATFSVAAYPNRVFEGRVIQVRQSPQTIQNVVTYDIIVGVDNKNLLLMPGMTADVRITTAQSADALRVPVEALRYWPESVPKPSQARSAAARIWVLRDGRPQAVPVVVGLTDDRYAEIKQGALSASDRVVIGERSAGTAPSHPAAANRPRAPFL
jgi:HlyD family secretion protein